VRGTPASSRLTRAETATDLVGGHVAARREAMRAGLLTGESQIHLWYRLMRYRYLVGVGLAGAALLPAVGPRRFWLAFLMVLVAIPFNAVYERVVLRTNVLNPTVAFADHVLAVAAVAFVPQIWAAAALFQLAVLANNVVAFGAWPRRPPWSATWASSWCCSSRATRACSPAWWPSA
jgi:hypothetical protein